MKANKKSDPAATAESDKNHVNPESCTGETTPNSPSGQTDRTPGASRSINETDHTAFSEDTRIPLERVQCQLYQNSWDNSGSPCGLSDIVSMISHGNVNLPRTGRTLREHINHIRDKVASLRLDGASNQTIKEAVARDKKQLPAVAFSGLFHVRKTHGIRKHTSLICIDIDDLIPERIASLKEAFMSDQHVIRTFTSPTLTGLKVLFRVGGLERWTSGEHLMQADYAEVTNRFHSAAFFAVEAYVRRVYQVPIDPHCKDVCRLCYLSYDPDDLVNWDAIPLPVLPPAAGTGAGPEVKPTPDDEGPHANTSAHAEEKKTTRGESDGSAGDAQPQSARAQEEQPRDGKRTTQYPALSAEEVRDILRYVQADDYCVWLMVLGAMKLWGQQQGDENLAFDIADQWAKSSSKYDAEAQRQKWEDLRRGEGENVATMGSVIRLAIKSGWKRKASKGKTQSREKGESGPPVSEYANRLEEIVGEVICIGDTWYQLSQGTWRPVDREPMRKPALEILDSDDEANSLALEVIRTVEGRKQRQRAELRGFAIEESPKSILLNCANGMLRVTPATVELLPHDSTRLFTRCLAAAYLPESVCPSFTRVLAEALPDEEDQMLAILFPSYCLIPNSQLEVALFVYGATGTAKSTIFESGFGNAMGVDVVKRLSMGELCSPGSYSLPDLEFAALNLSSEGQVGEIAESDVFKKLVESSPVVVRRIYGKPYEMAKCHVKVICLSNHLPRWKHGTDAELRRSRFLAFEHRPAHADPGLKARLTAERDGIFSKFLVPGLQELLTSYRMPMGGVNSVAVRQRFALENDPIGVFVSRHCELGKGLWISNSELGDVFKTFLDSEDLSSGLGSHFFRILRQRLPKLTLVRRTEHGIRVKGTGGIDLNASGHALTGERSEAIY